MTRRMTPEDRPQREMNMDLTKQDITAALQEIATAIRRVASGGGGGPDGIEALAIAVAGEGLEMPLGAAISELRVADAASEIREGLDGVAHSIDGLARAVARIADALETPRQAAE